MKGLNGYFFNWDEIKRMTNEFNEGNRIGSNKVCLISTWMSFISWYWIVVCIWSISVIQFDDRFYACDI